MSLLSTSLLADLTREAEQADVSTDFPGSWSALLESKALTWILPQEQGGIGGIERMVRLEKVAGACATTALILTQHDTAVRLLMNSPNEALTSTLFDRISSDQLTLTVGVAQLTTSGQHRPPVLIATPTASGFRLDGKAPWVTAADRAQGIVVGAVLPDHRQILAFIDGSRYGLQIAPPTPLAALSGSRTATITFDGYPIDAHHLVAGPMTQVMGTSGGGGLDTSCVALGLGGAATAWIYSETLKRPELLPAFETFIGEADDLRNELHRLTSESSGTDSVHALRIKSTLFALRATQACLVAARGAGFVPPHPAARWARQAHFCLVWSCPKNVSEGVLEGLVKAHFK
jgi:butyryl-CoA dehydrogenase